ncbi:MAG: DnaA/Hda family protein [Rhodospirillales bacterium]|nr:DnaA/Hda family protein [Rhodospirillales bacterium]
MTPQAQLRLEFEPRPALGGDDFLVAPNNAEAVTWLDRWPDWPSTALVIHGPPGCGKSHLCQVFLAASEARHIGVSDLTRNPADVLLADAPAAVIDRAETALAAGAERPLFHLFNHLSETGRKLLLTARAPVSRWPVDLPDLHSRLATAVSAEIGPPDDPLIAAVIVKLFADRQLRIDDGVVTYLLSRMERSFDAARQLVSAIDDAALAEHRNITVPLVRKVLKAIERI